MITGRPEVLYTRKNYLTDIRFLNSVCITEYDIRSANISVLRDSNVISQDECDALRVLPKIDREIYIGKIIAKNPNVDNIIQNGIINAKKNLFEANNIQNNEIIRIANDAVYVMRNQPLQYTKFGNVEFVTKNKYSLFCRVGLLTFFFNTNMGDIDLDVIGLGKDQMFLHQDYMLSFIGNLFYLVEASTPENVLEYFTGFYNQYLRKELPMGYYRELNSDSLYIISYAGGRYGMTEYNSVNGLDIGYNASIMRELYGYIIALYKR